MTPSNLSFENAIKELASLRLDIPHLGLVFPICEAEANYVNDVDWTGLVDNWRLYGADAIDANTLQKTPLTIYAADDLIKLLVFGTNKTNVELPDYPWTATRLFKAEPALRTLGKVLASRRDLPLADIVALALNEYAQLISRVETVN